MPAIPGIGYSISGRSAAETPRIARLAEEAGIDIVALGDNQHGHREAYALLALCAAATSTIRLGPLVTNPLTRHASVTAAAIATIAEAAGGRTFLGIGRGNASVKNAGLPRATPDQLRACIAAVNAAFDTMAWVERRVPILVHAGGPKTIEVAVELADGIVFRWGDHPQHTLGAHLADIRRMREHGPLAGQRFHIWTIVSTCVTSDVAAARAEIDLAHRARSLPVAEWPPHLAEAARAYRRAYQFAHHASRTNKVNQRLLAEHGLADFIVDRYALIGDVAAIGRRILDAAALGVDAVIVAQVDPPNVASSEESRVADVAALRNALAASRSASAS